MKLNKFTLFLIFVAFLSGIQVSIGQGRKLYAGQTKTRINSSIPISRKIAYPWTWTFGLGGTIYNGDMYDVATDGINFTNYQFNVGLKYRFTNRLSAGATIRHFKIGASDVNSDAPGRAERNISFQTFGYELIAYGTFDIIPTISRFMGDKSDQYNRRNFFVPYLIAGAGVLYFNPQGLNPKTKQYENVASVITFEEKRKSPYSQIVPVIAGGIGFRMKISEFFDLGADITNTIAFSDYLDDMGNKNTYPTGNRSDSNFVFRSNQYLLADPSYTGDPNSSPRDENSSSAIERSRGSSKGSFFTSFDSYFIANFRIDYTMSSPFAFGRQRTHQHFRKGKGSKHHRFDRK